MKITDFEINENSVFGKIPVIYCNQAKPKKDDVERLMNDLQIFDSNNADTNDYLGSPVIVVKRKITDF